MKPTPDFSDLTKPQKFLALWYLNEPNAPLDVAAAIAQYAARYYGKKKASQINKSRTVHYIVDVLAARQDASA